MIVEAATVTEDGLTGRIRYRPKTRWLRAPLLVLQLEECREISYNEGHVTRSVCFWRDARIEDILTDGVDSGR